MFRAGAVIPAHPLALDADRRLDPRRQRALTRYYLDAGAGGLAVGVHTTQFAIREAGLYQPVLELAAETAAGWTDRPLFLIAGAIGRTEQAVAEARTARSLGYHAVLLSLAALKGESEDALVAHCRAVAERDAGRRLLPPAGGRRRAPASQLLATSGRDRQRRRHQGRPLRPLRDARRRPRRRRGRAPGSASPSTPATTTTSCST